MCAQFYNYTECKVIFLCVEGGVEPQDVDVGDKEPTRNPVFHPERDLPNWFVFINPGSVPCTNRLCFGHSLKLSARVH